MSEMDERDLEIEVLRTALRMIAFYAHNSRRLQSAMFKGLTLEDIERMAREALGEPDVKLEIVKK